MTVRQELPRTVRSALIALALSAPALLAQRARPTSARADFIGAGDLLRYRDRAVRARAQGTTVLTAPDQQTNYVIVVRTRESAVERHSRWDDFIIGRNGSGIVRLGQSASGMRTLAPGEYRGGVLARPADLHVGPGDVVRVPAGVAHAFVPDAGSPFEFLLIKVRRPNKPLR